MRNSRGFTLAELMMTVVIAAVLAGIAIPSFKDMRDRNSVTTEANDMLSSILLARSEAVKREQQIRFSWTAGPPIAVAVLAELVPGSNVFNDVLMQHTLDPNSVSVIVPNGTVATITFSPRGRAAMNPAADFFQITRTRPNYRYRSCILFSANGRPSVVKDSDDPGDICI